MLLCKRRNTYHLTGDLRFPDMDERGLEAVGLAFNPGRYRFKCPKQPVWIDILPRCDSIDVLIQYTKWPIPYSRAKGNTSGTCPCKKNGAGIH